MFFIEIDRNSDTAYSKDEHDPNRVKFFVSQGINKTSHPRPDKTDYSCIEKKNFQYT